MGLIALILALVALVVAARALARTPPQKPLESKPVQRATRRTPCCGGLGGEDCCEPGLRDTGYDDPPGLR